jgi:hypothetical protein
MVSLREFNNRGILSAAFDCIRNASDTELETILVELICAVGERPSMDLDLAGAYPSADVRRRGLQRIAEAVATALDT